MLALRASHSTWYCITAGGWFEPISPNFIKCAPNLSYIHFGKIGFGHQDFLNGIAVPQLHVSLSVCEDCSIAPCCKEKARERLKICESKTPYREILLSLKRFPFHLSLTGKTTVTVQAQAGGADRGLKQRHNLWGRRTI